MNFLCRSLRATHDTSNHIRQFVWTYDTMHDILNDTRQLNADMSHGLRHYQENINWRFTSSCVVSKCRVSYRLSNSNAVCSLMCRFVSRASFSKARHTTVDTCKTHNNALRLTTFYRPNVMVFSRSFQLLPKIYILTIDIRTDTREHMTTSVIKCRAIV